MFHRIASFAIAIAAAGIIAGAQPGLAEEKSAPPHLATVDMQYLLQNCEAAKSARSQIEQMRSGFQLALKGEQDNITQLDQSLNQQRTSLSQDALQQRVQDLRQKAMGYQRDVQEHQAQITRALSGATIEIERKIVAIVDTLRKEHGYTAVFNRSAIVGGADLPDVTQEALVQLNLQLPLVAVDTKGTEMATAGAKPQTPAAPAK